MEMCICRYSYELQIHSVPPHRAPWSSILIQSSLQVVIFLRSPRQNPLPTCPPRLPHARPLSSLISSPLITLSESQDWFPVVSLDFSVTYFLPTLPWPWGRLSPQWTWVPGTFLRVKTPGAWGWPHHLHVPNVMKSGSLNLLEHSGPHRACYGTAF
jgi:hypothetical protein